MVELKNEELFNYLKKFKHNIPVRVYFADVDSFFVVHNIKYLYWIEFAREEYLINLMKDYKEKSDIYNFPLIVVHNSIDFYNPARYRDLLMIHTRISKIGESSVHFENLVTRDETLIAIAKAIMVKINPKEGKSEPLPEEFRKIINRFEGDEIIV